MRHIFLEQEKSLHSKIKFFISALALMATLYVGSWTDEVITKGLLLEMLILIAAPFQVITKMLLLKLLLLKLVLLLKLSVITK